MRQGEQRRQIAGGLFQRRPGHVAGETQEFIAARHEVGLAIHFHENGNVAGALHGDGPFGGHPRGLLVGLGEARLAHQFRGGIQIALGFDQRLLAFHHSGAGALTKLFDCVCRNIHVFKNGRGRLFSSKM